jgi:Cdc6-like AAA superfamily ATPase
VLKQADCVANSVSTLCTTYKALAGAAAASKGDTMANSTDGVPDHTEPVAEQQELMDYYDALEALMLRGMGCTLPLRVREVAEVHSIVTDAIAGNRGASVPVRGPAGSGKYRALVSKLNGPVQDWCKQHGKVEPVVWLNGVRSQDCERSAGLYGAILRALRTAKPLQIGEVSEAAAEAKKQLEDFVFSSDVPLMVLQLHRVDDLLPTYSDQLQQLFEWTTGSKLILITTARADLTQAMPGLQQLGTTPVQVVFEPFPDSDLVAILEDDLYHLDRPVQPAALKLWAKHASGDASRALRLCEFTLQWAVSAETGVTLRLIEQAARFMAMLK